MRQFLILTIAALLFSCSNATKESTKSSDVQLEEQTGKAISTAEVTKTPEPTKHEFQKETMLSLSNSTWINSPFPNCTDTLKIISNDGQYYSCEHELDYDIQYSIEADTLYIDKYGLISEETADSGTEIKTKYKMIKSDDLLIIVGIAHKIQDRYEPVGEEYLFQEFRKVE